MFELVYRFDPEDRRGQAPPKTPEEAHARLVKGNNNFAELTDIRSRHLRRHAINIDPAAFEWGAAEGEAPKQAPFAAVLGCSDARVPTEMIFSNAANKIFVVRVAGNVLGSECMGSLHYAVKQFPTLKVIVVLAHGRCGAVTHAVDVFLTPRKYIDIASDAPLRSIHDQILVAVRVAALGIEEVYGTAAKKREGYRDALLETAVVINAAWTAYCLEQEFRERRRKDLGIYFGTYDLVTRYVRLPISRPHAALTAKEKGLFRPPQDVAGFKRLSLEICQGALVQSFLQK